MNNIKIDEIDKILEKDDIDSFKIKYGEDKLKEFLDMSDGEKLIVDEEEMCNNEVYKIVKRMALYYSCEKIMEYIMKTGEETGELTDKCYKIMCKRIDEESILTILCKNNLTLLKKLMNHIPYEMRNNVIKYQLLFSLDLNEETAIYLMNNGANLNDIDHVGSVPYMYCNSKIRKILKEKTDMVLVKNLIDTKLLAASWELSGEVSLTNDKGIKSRLFSLEYGIPIIYILAMRKSLKQYIKTNLYNSYNSHIIEFIQNMSLTIKCCDKNYIIDDKYHNNNLFILPILINTHIFYLVIYNNYFLLSDTHSNNVDIYVFDNQYKLDLIKNYHKIPNVDLMDNLKTSSPIISINLSLKNFTAFCSWTCLHYSFLSFLLFKYILNNNLIDSTASLSLYPSLPSFMNPPFEVYNSWKSHDRLTKFNNALSNKCIDPLLIQSILSKQILEKFSLNLSIGSFLNSSRILSKYCYLFKHIKPLANSNSTIIKFSPFYHLYLDNNTYSTIIKDPTLVSSTLQTVLDCILHCEFTLLLTSLSYNKNRHRLINNYVKTISPSTCFSN